jgi:hypothetical protein
MCKGQSLQAELVFLRNFFKQKSYNSRQSHSVLNRRPHVGQQDNKST